jgi:WhiB family redox-sensing transcriptional regulator
MVPGYARSLMVPGEVADVSDLYDRPPFQALAACRGMGSDVFIIGRGASTERARAVCARCCVADACLEYALSDDELVGVWGGTSEVERRAMRRASA